MDHSLEKVVLKIGVIRVNHIRIIVSIIGLFGIKFRLPIEASLVSVIVLDRVVVYL